MSPIKLAWLELRRFRGHPIRVAALIAVMAIPLVYGGLYLWFAWDPYGRTGDMPVAVVNEDQGATLAGDDGDENLNGGDQLVSQLKETPIFDWDFTDADTARKGLEEGDYYMVITVPEDFSAKLSTLDGEQNPQQATVSFDLNDANGYIAGIMAETVELQLQQQINTAVYITFATTVFGDLAELSDGLGAAADGAGELATGLESAQSGAADLDSGLQTLTSGAVEVSDGVDQVVDIAQPVIAGLGDNWSQIQAASGSAADLTNTAATDLQAVYDTLCADGTDSTDPAADPGACQTLSDAVAEAQEINTDVQTGNGAVQAVSTDQLQSAFSDLADLKTGAAEVASGASDAESGAAGLSSGLSDLQDGAATLSTSLTDAAGQVPSDDPAADAGNADVYGSPVAIEENNLNPADTYGRGLAPFFIAISLWVFGLVAYLLMRTSNSRAVAGPLWSSAVAAGGWLAAAVVGALGAILLYAVTDIGLGLNPKQVFATIGFALLTVAVFTALAHLLKLSLGIAGSLILVVLLMLQLTSAGGLYPIEVTPGFFQFLHPLLPMGYVVDGLRVTISGGETSHLLRAVAVLAGYGIAALVASSLVIAGRRKWSMNLMKPHLDV